MAQFDSVPDHHKKSKFRNLTEPERLVARRLAQFRRWKGLSQAVLAKRVGLTRSKIANIEKERVTLRFDDVVKIAEILGVNVAWLADGIGTPTYFTPLDPSIASKLSASTEFLKGYAETRIYHRFFKPLSSADKLELKLTAMGDTIENAIARLPDQIEALIALCPPEFHPELYLAINNTIRDFTRAREKELRRAAIISANSDEDSQKPTLDDGNALVTNEDVRPILPTLLKRLNAATQGRGQKAALAKYLDVLPQMVSQWLSGAREPGGETTLRLLHWVEQQERKT